MEAIAQLAGKRVWLSWQHCAVFRDDCWLVWRGQCESVSHSSSLKIIICRGETSTLSLGWENKSAVIRNIFPKGLYLMTCLCYLGLLMQWCLELQFLELCLVYKYWNTTKISSNCAKTVEFKVKDWYWVIVYKLYYFTLMQLIFKTGIRWQHCL